MKEYRHALALLKEASALVESVGDTLVAAHIATPLALLEDRLYAQDDTACRDRPVRE